MKPSPSNNQSSPAPALPHPSTGIRHPASLSITRRHFFGINGTGVGIAALASLLDRDAPAAATAHGAQGALPGLPHFPPTAKRVIYLF